MHWESLAYRRPGVPEVPSIPGFPGALGDPGTVCRLPVVASGVDAALLCVVLIAVSVLWRPGDMPDKAISTITGAAAGDVGQEFSAASAGGSNEAAVICPS